MNNYSDTEDSEIDDTIWIITSKNGHNSWMEMSDFEYDLLADPAEILEADDRNVCYQGNISVAT